MQDQIKQIETVNASGELTESRLMTNDSQFSKEDYAEVMEKIKSLSKLKTGISLTPKYYEFKSIGESVRGVFVGIKYMTVNDEKIEGEKKVIPAVGWVDENEEVLLNAGVSLVSAFVENGIKPKTSVLITFEEEKKAGAGKVKIYSVKPLI